jgi:hypothetical protein
MRVLLISKVKTYHLFTIFILCFGCALALTACGGGEIGGSVQQVQNPVPSNNWAFLGAPTINGQSYPQVTQIVVDPEDMKILYIDVNDSGLFISRDGGISWTNPIQRGNHLGYGVITPDPSDSSRLLYGKSNKLYVTNDRGLTWNLVATFDSSVYLASLAVSKLDPHTIYAGACGSMFYRSRDDGVAWQAFPYGPSVGTHNFMPYTLAEDPTEGILYTGGEFGETHPHPYEPLLRSMDRGETWENVAPLDVISGANTMGMAVHITINPVSHKVYVLPEGNVIYASTDHGLTWKRAYSGYLHGAFVRDPNQANRFFGGVNNNGINTHGGAFISTDDAEIFIKFGMEGYAVSDLSLSGDSMHLYAASYGTGIFVTAVPPPTGP